MNEKERWNGFSPRGGWSRNDKSREAQRFKYVTARAMALREGKEEEQRALILLCEPACSAARYRSRVFAEIADAWACSAPMMAAAAWEIALATVDKQVGSYDFLECVPQLVTVAGRRGWLTRPLAARLHRCVVSAAASSSYGWEDSHLLACREVLPMLEAVIAGTFDGS